MLEFGAMKLYINTIDKSEIIVKLIDKSREVDSLADHNEFGSQVLLGLVEKILKKNNFKYQDLNGIEVEVGPGSYTGLKVGVAVANALAFSLKIPVNKKQIEADLTY